MREALDRFLGGLAVSRASPHTVTAYRRDITGVLDRIAGAGKPVAPAQWTRERLEQAAR